MMIGSETVQEHNLPLAKGSLRLSWELHRPNYGNTIAIQTGENCSYITRPRHHLPWPCAGAMLTLVLPCLATW